MVEASGAYPSMPAVPPLTGRADVPPRGKRTEEDVLASWLEVLIADGLVPAGALPLNPF